MMNSLLLVEDDRSITDSLSAFLASVFNTVTTNIHLRKRELAMLYSMHKLRKENVIETLRNENI